MSDAKQRFFALSHPSSLILLILLILVLTACTPREQEMRVAEAKPAITSEAFLPGDGASLPLRIWKPKGAPKAVLIALHGFNDYSNAFEAPAKYFASQGILTYAYDQRGFGESEEAGIWGNTENLTRDLTRMIDAARAKHPRVPVFVLGESMGGAVVIATLTGHTPQVKGAILSAPAVWGGEYMSPFYRATLWMGAYTLPWKTVTGEGLKIQASDNIEMLRGLGRDPLVIKQTRLDAIYGLVNLMDNAYDRAGEVNVPALVLYGEKDQVIPGPPVKDAAGRMPNVTFTDYPEGWHMLLRDLQAKKVWKDIVKWMSAQRQTR